MTFILKNIVSTTENNLSKKGVFLINKKNHMAKVLGKRDPNSVMVANSSVAQGIQLVGAVLNGDSKSLFKIIKDKSKEDGVKFCALAGIFFLVAKVTQKDEHEEGGIRDVLQLEYSGEVFEELTRLIELWEQILQKDEYHNYPIPILPEANISKEIFWQETLSGMTEILFEGIFGKPTNFKGRLHNRANLLNKVLSIVSLYQLTKPEAFHKAVRVRGCKVLDEMYARNFSNSVNKIWDAQRAGREYFLRKALLFNPLIPKVTQEAIDKRWQAWFLLEDKYKTDEKKVVRGKLLVELNLVLKEL